MIKKGIILAGGKGTRMSPLTKAVNKQLLPIYDKPLLFYPLSILMLSKIKDILIIVNKGQLEQYKKILPNGKNLGIKITYLEQSKPRGLPDAFVSPSLNNEFKEYQFSVDNLEEFVGYKIKIVMNGTNEAKSPSFKDLRTIALA